MKRILAVILCIALLAAVLPGQAFAAETTREQEVIRAARKLYYRCLSTAQKDSFTGYCGLMTSHQLWNLGINEWCRVYNGKDQFDAYKDMGVTDGGYYIGVYSAQEFTLENALNTVCRSGAQDVYNILVGFERTATESGKDYGHSVLINAILDGQVYFVESYTMGPGKTEGTVLCMSVAEFARIYGNGKTFEGIIYFGTGQYIDSCTRMDCDVFVQSRFESVLRSVPCLVGENDCATLRSIAPGEVLHATGLYKNPQGDLFYRISDGELEGYVAASALCAQQLNTDDLWASLQASSVRQAVSITGTVSAANSKIGTVDITVTDSTGAVVAKEAATVDACVYSLDLSTDTLEPGSYTVTVRADAASIVADGGVCKSRTRSVELWSQGVTVTGQGETEKTDTQAVSYPTEIPVLDGWLWQNGSWYCYDQGSPCTGWVSRNGVQCYLDESGRAVSGWTEVDGRQRYFSGSGALCSGWLATEAGMLWLDAGATVAGLQTIGTRLYWFSEEGLLVTGGTITVDGVVYELQSDGRAVQVTE